MKYAKKNWESSKPCFLFKKEGNVYICDTTKGSRIVIYNRAGRHDWFIKEANKKPYEKPVLSTIQQQEAANEPAYNDFGWPTAEEAIQDFILTTSKVYDKEFIYYVE